MAANGAGSFAAAILPLTLRRDAFAAVAQIRPLSNSKLSVIASAVRTEKHPQETTYSISENGAAAKAAAASSSEAEERRASLRDYFEQSLELISKSDGGAPRWLSPSECGSPVKDSPLLLYIPGVDGVGMGLLLHHQRLSKIFNIECMHIPLSDRTPFTELVKFVESRVRTEHSCAPNRPIYLLGDSFGACLALAVAARNPNFDLPLILVNPATSFERSQLQTQTVLNLSPFMPQQLASALPYLLTLLVGNPAKIVTAAMSKGLPSDQVINELSQETIAMSSYLSALSNLFTVETFRWKLNLLKTAAAFTNSRLHAVKSQTLILASGQDQLLPSRDEAERLRKVLPNCKVRVFEDSGHALLLEDGMSLVSVLNGASFYRRGQRHDYVSDYLPPSQSEFWKIYSPQSWIAAATDPVVLSTTGNGDIVRGLGGVPSEGPVLYVGYHMMLGFEIAPLVARFWTERNILLRGVAHPMMFEKVKEGRLPDISSFDTFRIMGAVPVSAPNFFKLFSSKSHVLLYPGGVREALHRKGEEYKLFWPEQTEFVRMAARFGAKIVPFGVVGEDDVSHFLMDYDDLRSIPYFRNAIEEITGETKNLRGNSAGEVANQDVYLPVLAPKIPGRFYYLFGKPIETLGRKEELKNREKAQELYLEVKSEVEKCLDYLKEKRESDPYRNIFARLSYQAMHGFDAEVPTFDFRAETQT